MVFGGILHKAFCGDPRVVLRVNLRVVLRGKLRKAPSVDFPVELHFVRLP